MQYTLLAVYSAQCKVQVLKCIAVQYTTFVKLCEAKPWLKGESTKLHPLHPLQSRLTQSRLRIGAVYPVNKKEQKGQKEQKGSTTMIIKRQMRTGRGEMFQS